MKLKRLPNPEAHKKFIVSFCNKGNITVRFIPGLRVPAASYRNGKAIVLLKEPLITDLEDSQWDSDSYHEAGHLLPEQLFVYKVLRDRIETGLEKSILNVLADNMSERCRHGKYKGRDRSLYNGRYEYVIANRDTVMQRKHPSLSALYVVDFRDRNTWQGFFPDMEGMEGADYYLPSIEALDIGSRIQYINEHEDEDELYELTMDIANLSKQQPPPKKQEEQPDDNDDDDTDDSGDGSSIPDNDMDDSDDTDSDRGGNSESDAQDGEQDDSSIEAGRSEDDSEVASSEGGEEGEGEDTDREDQMDNDTGDQSGESGENGGDNETEETDGSEGSSDNDGHGNSGDIDGDSGDSDGDSDGSSSDDSGELGEPTDSSGDGDSNGDDSDDIPGGDGSAGGDGCGSTCSWEPVDEDALDIADEDRQLREMDQYVNEEIRRGHYTPIANYQLTPVKNLRNRLNHFNGIKRNCDGTTLTRSIQKYLRCMSRDTYQYGLPRGRLHSKQISRIFSADRNPKIYKQKQSHILRTDTAVQLLVDCSSSMESERYIVGGAAAVVISDTLRELQIAHEILGFTETMRTIHIYEFKAFSEQLCHDRVVERMSKNFGMHYTPDAESIVFAGARLMDRPEENKVLIVLCDGQPMGNFDGDGEWYLQQVCKTIEESGLIQLIGIGIQHSGVKRFYKNHAVVKDLKRDLEPVMLEVLTKQLF